VTMLTRRVFLALAGATLAAGPRSWAKDVVPLDLDHILLGVSDLDFGIAWVQERTGIRAAVGGVHPGRSTRNALLALGPRRYLEIIAPDPQQTLQGLALQLKTMREPRVFNWAVHTNDIAAAAKNAVAAGLAIEGPRDGSRTRPDGKTLRWKSFSLKDDRGGLLPFFIEWSPDSVHPSEDAPAGCTLRRFVIATSESRELATDCRRLHLNVIVEHSNESRLRALIKSAKGEIEL
jgi:Glyoxalase-like domain